MFCTQCGESSTASVSFCGNCGTAINREHPVLPAKSSESTRTERGPLSQWYHGVNEHQAALLWGVAFCLVPLFGIGLILLAVLLYLHLGEHGGKGRPKE